MFTSHAVKIGEIRCFPINETVLMNWCSFLTTGFQQECATGQS